MSFHVTYNFVQGYDLGQKKIVASEVDQNFSDVEAAINDLIDSEDKLPVGSIIWSAASTVPAGYLLCNGASVGRDTYPELFAAIGTTYGEGDGSTTFNLPNMIGRFIEGASTAGTVKAAGLPNITAPGGIIAGLWAETSSIPNLANSALYFSSTSANVKNDLVSTTTTSSGRVAFDASRSNHIYGASTTVQPPSVTALPCIKY